MVLPQRIHARHPRVKGVVSAAVGSEFVFGAAQSGQRVDRVEGDDQRIGGLEAQHRFDGGEVGDDECQAATRIVASNAQRAAISFLLDLRGGARTAVASVA